MGNFKDLIRQVTFGPAMMIWLDIYQWFLYNEPDMNFIDQMANILRNNNYELKPALEYFFQVSIFTMRIL